MPWLVPGSESGYAAFRPLIFMRVSENHTAYADRGVRVGELRQHIGAAFALRAVRPASSNSFSLFRD